MAKAKDKVTINEGAKHPQALVTIIATEYSKYMKTGKEYNVTAPLAARLVKTKQATLK